MYDSLNAVAGDLGRIKTLVAEPDADPALQALRAALEQTADRLNARGGSTDVEHKDVAILYRGMLAASRIVGQLREHHQATTA
jgi:hypothetical protein